MTDRSDDITQAFDETLGPLPPGVPSDRLDDIRQRRGGDADVATLFEEIDRCHAAMERVQLILSEITNLDSPD